jgi:RimJ/RimL family protein N-acetyltransferase
MHIEPFQSRHLEILVLQPSQAAVSVFFDDEYGPALKAAGPCFTAMDGDEVLACAGVVKQWDNRAIAWGLISEYAGKQFVRIHKAVKRFLDTTDFNRVEAFVDADFEAGHRWIQMLGFEREGYMRAFSPLGKDCILYARIKHG